MNDTTNQNEIPETLPFSEVDLKDESIHLETFGTKMAITLNLPLRHTYGRARSIEQSREFLMSSVRLDLGTLFDLVKTCAVALTDTNLEPQDIGEQLEFLSKIGESLASSLEDIEITFDKWQDEITVGDVCAFWEVPTEGGRQSYAKKLYEAIHSEHSEQGNAALELVNDMNGGGLDVYTPELISRLVCDEENAGFFPRLQNIIAGGKK